jgi:DNA polymerase III epsilon subunit-like protein
MQRFDTETSGLDSSQDQVIEVGIQLSFVSDLPSQDTWTVVDSLSHILLQDPGFTSLKFKVTGITNSLTGQQINWDR